MTWRWLWILALALAAAATPLHTQVPGGASVREVLLTTEFRAPLSYQAALTKLDDYYQLQVGRKVAVVLPEIGPLQHFEVWHDLWVSFQASGGQSVISIKGAADNITIPTRKGWMLGIAGWLGAELPLEYQELPPLRTAEADIYATPKDVAAALQKQPSMKALKSWNHAGLMVSASPLTAVVMAPAGVHGVHHLTVTTVSAPAARVLMAQVMQAMLKPCICAVFSESAELDDEIEQIAQTKLDTIGTTASQSIYVPQVSPKYMEERVRAEPEMQKRIASAAGYYDIRYRVDKPFRQVTLTWHALEGYSRQDRKFRGDRPVGKVSIANPRTSSPASGQLNARIRMEHLEPGAYRIRLEGETAPGNQASIDERIYWYDGKTFEEL